MVIGAPNASRSQSPFESFAGAVYVFVRNAGIWTEQAYIDSPFPYPPPSLFGSSVAVSADTLVGGGQVCPSCPDVSEGAYIFVRSAEVWDPQARLKGSNDEPQDFFATSAAVSGGTVVVGAPREASNATGVNGNQSDNSAPQSGAAYVFTPGPEPIAVSVSPAAGSGQKVALALTYSDPDGFTDLKYTYALIKHAIDSNNACYLIYYRPGNFLYLLTNGGQMGAPATPGRAGMLENSQCSVDLFQTSVTASGNNLTLTVALTFKPEFRGTKNIYMNAQDTGGNWAGWTSRGTWTPSPNATPAPVSVSPSGGTGSNATLVLTYSDSDGFADLNYGFVLINNVINARNSCYVLYNRPMNALYLGTDDGVSLQGPLTLGTAGTIENSQCILAGSGSSVSASGTNLVLTLRLTFKPAFAGPKDIYMSAQDVACVVADWINRGAWTAN